VSLGELYELHHRERRNDGDFVFVPERIPLIKEAVGRGHNVLDLGCRSGALTRHFLDGNEVVGVDVDQAALAKAEKLGIKPVVADVQEPPLPFEDEAFDAVVAGELLEHLGFPELLIAEILRVLEPGGVLVGSVPNAFRIQGRLRFLLGRPPEEDPTHLHMFSPEQIRELLADFEDVDLTYVGGRYRPLHPRLLARDLVFSAVRPAA
jgi:SAM-dependent methyltransferase